VNDQHVDERLSTGVAGDHGTVGLVIELANCHARYLAVM
jgi:hypothetical protein